MLFSPDILPQQIILLLTIGLSIGLVIGYLYWRNRLDSARPLLIPIFFFVVFGTLDALMTMRVIWNAPWREGNSVIRAFLEWGGWWGQCVGTAVWVVSWSLFVDGLESLRRRVDGRWGTLLSWGRLLTVYVLAVGHLDGFVSWTDSPSRLVDLFSGFDRFLWQKAAWLRDFSPFGWPLYTGLFFGGLCALLHCGLASVLRHRRFSDPQRP